MIVVFGIFLFAITHQTVFSVEPTEWQKYQHGRFETLIKQWQEEIFETWSSSILDIQHGNRTENTKGIHQRLTVWQNELQQVLEANFKNWTGSITERLLTDISIFSTTEDCGEIEAGLQALIHKLGLELDKMQQNFRTQLLTNFHEEFSRLEKLKSRLAFLRTENSLQNPKRCGTAFQLKYDQVALRILTLETNIKSRQKRERVMGLIEKLSTQKFQEFKSDLESMVTSEREIFLEEVIYELLRHKRDENMLHIRCAVRSLATHAPALAEQLTIAALKDLKITQLLASTYTLQLAHTVHHAVTQNVSNPLENFPRQIQNLFSNQAVCIRNFHYDMYVREKEYPVPIEKLENTNELVLELKSSGNGFTVTSAECGWEIQVVSATCNDPVVFRFHRKFDDTQRTWTLGSRGDEVLLTSGEGRNLNLNWQVQPIRTAKGIGESGIGFKFRPFDTSREASKVVCRDWSYAWARAGWGWKYFPTPKLTRGPSYNQDVDACTWVLHPV